MNADPRPFVVRERVRAPLDVVYALEAFSIPAGTRGTVERVTHGGFVAHVRWDGWPFVVPTLFVALAHDGAREAA